MIILPLSLFSNFKIYLAGVSISDGQDSGTDPPTYNVLSNWIFDGIDISKVEDIDQSGNPGSLDLPNITDSSGKPLYTGLYSGPYFDLSR